MMRATTETYQGKPCKRNSAHPGIRYRSSHGCVDCCREDGEKRRKEKLQKSEAEKAPCPIA